MTGFSGGIKNNYLATAGGGLPFHEAQAALNFVFENFSYHIPFLPSLPRRSFFEKMIVQFSEQLPCLKVDEPRKKVWIDTRDPGFAVALEECFNRCMALDVDYFSISPQSSPVLRLMSQRLMGVNWQGWVKFQIVGPISHVMKLCDEKGAAIFFHEELNELAALVLSLKAAWLIKQLKVHVKTKIIVVIDESFICLKECALSLEEGIEKLSCIINIIHDNGALVALKVSSEHDFHYALQMPIDLLCFDAYAAIGRLGVYEKIFASFLKKGGMPILEIVPCCGQEIQDENFKDHLFKLLKSRPFLLKNGALISTRSSHDNCSLDSFQKATNICIDLVEDLRRAF